MKNKDIVKEGLEFLLKSCNRDQNCYINLRGGGQKFTQIYESVFHPLPTDNY